MFFRLKKSGERAYVQIVENKRVDGAVRQSVIATLGRADELGASGALASLLASGAKLTDQVLLINALEEDADGALSASAKRIGGPLLFGKIWERLGIADVLGDLLRDRAFEFAVERAVFVATLHRIFVSGSDRDCSSWMEDYDIAGSDGLDLHHFYRAMAWLGEEMEEKSEDALAPRCVKDVIEEKLFDKRRDLFADLSAVFMDRPMSRCRREPDKPPRRRPRPPQNPSQNVEAAPGVVPRHLEFRRKLMKIRGLPKLGVQVGP